MRPQAPVPVAGVAEPRHASQPDFAALWQFRAMRANVLKMLVLTLTVAGSVPAARVADAAEAAPPPAAPDFALKATDGHNYRLSEYRGEVVALVFWASWCGACRRELERLGELRGIYGDAGLRALAVSVDDDAQAAVAIARSAGTGFPVLHDSAKTVSKAYALESLPTTVLIDRAGRIRSVHGERDVAGERRLLGELRTLLDE